ncbi:hypothetical protein OG765_00365 [Streptomyces sp. NBC_00555]|uniref:hypothetical protein n=1 Tax=Streptomyces sp. NBC_00555 TaxID=2903662 RepID=UPI0022577F6E|nr:hypothetical protein [Streptomyces sp. NBC_00555]MCX5009468.1 hypothetical protein [Streptomyces sp. NBC_00555]
MPRPLPLSLRAWSGVLLVCALFACLTGLARPAMAMEMPMQGATDTTRHVAVRGHAEASAAVAVTDHGPRCPVAQEQCVAPKGVLTQDGPTTPVLVIVPHATDGSPTLPRPWPHAPPPAAAPPDLHRLCVSRT